MPILAPRCLGSASDSERGVGGRFEQEIVDHGLVLVGNVGDRRRQREHHMEVRHRQELGHLRTLFNWAIARGIYGVDRSPCDRLRPAAVIGKKQARQRVLNDQELRAASAATGELGYPYVQLFRLLIVTG